MATRIFSAAPTVSIGLPVYNGERYLSVAIESVRKQTFRDFRLVISDNASTDRTAEICQRFASIDPRIFYHRQTANLGAGTNFNRVFQLASGSIFFKWLAHDDWIAPTFLERCVSTLEHNPQLVLCNSAVEIVDDDSRLLELYDPEDTAGCKRQSDRLRVQLWSRRCLNVFGVIRNDVLVSTSLFVNQLSSDRTLLIELALCGRFAQLPERLSFNRDHAGRFTRSGFTPLQELRWHGASGVRQSAALRTWNLYRRSVQLVSERVTNRTERIRCYYQILRSLRFRYRWAYLALEPLLLLDPRYFEIVMAIKRRLRRHKARSVPQPGDRGDPNADKLDDPAAQADQCPGV